MGYLKDLTERSAATFLELARIMIPIMVLIRIGEEFDLSEKLGLLLGPVMGIAGLPPEAGIVWAVTLLTNIYGGMGAYLSLYSKLNLSVGELSILCTMMLFAHSLPVEQAIVHRAGSNPIITGALRVISALVFGAITSWAFTLTGAFSESAALPEITGMMIGGLEDPGWLVWALATVKSLVFMMLIIILLFILLDVLERIGVIAKITKLLTPLLKRIGLDPQLAPLTTIGLLLGLSYGGGLIIQSAKKNNFSGRALFMSLAFLCLSHALIEDTALLLVLGADIWIILVGRLVFSLILIAALAKGINLFSIYRNERCKTRD